MKSQTNTAFVVWRCDCGCGHVQKVDISKYSKRVQKGLQKDFNISPAHIQDYNWTPHKCRDCGQSCKAPNGHGTQKAEELTEITGRRQLILQAIATMEKATVRQIDLFLHTNFEIQTTDNSTHSRVSELLYWGLIRQVDIEGPTAPADIYPDSKAVAYILNQERVSLLEKHGWQTWILRAVDAGLSYNIASFAEAS